MRSYPPSSEAGTLLDRARAEIERHARARAVPLAEQMVVLPLSLTTVLARIEAARGRWRVSPGAFTWQVTASDGIEFDRQFVTDHPEYRFSSRYRVGAGIGAVAVEWSETRFMLAGVPHKDRDSISTLVAGPSEKVLLEFLGEILRVRSRDSGRGVIAFGGLAGREELRVPMVPEGALVIPQSVSPEILRRIDRFWEVAPRALELGLSPRRGYLLTGPPGTGKTQFVRHLLSRYPDAAAFLHLAPSARIASLTLETMAAEAARISGPVIAIIEDVEKLLESRGTTLQFLLDVLDGLRDQPHPRLWIATTNEAQALDRSLTDRPGRFDELLIFDLPGPAQRRAMFQRWGAGELAPEALDEAVRLAEGMTGAHIRFACEEARMSELTALQPFAEELPAVLLRVTRGREAVRAHAPATGRAQTGFVGTNGR